MSDREQADPPRGVRRSDAWPLSAAPLPGVPWAQTRPQRLADQTLQQWAGWVAPASDSLYPAEWATPETVRHRSPQVAPDPVGSLRQRPRFTGDLTAAADLTPRHRPRRSTPRPPEPLTARLTRNAGGIAFLVLMLVIVVIGFASR